MAAQQHHLPKRADPPIDTELDRLAVMPIAELRVRYRALFSAGPPKAFGPDLLRRSVAHRIQEKAYGGLPRPTQRLLDQMVKAFAAKPGGRIALPRRIKPGSILVRQWKGKSHRVTVLAEGFAYDGNTYSNLSEIAGLITGTRWNGPRFFGLRANAADASSTGSPSRERPNGSGAASIQRRHFGGGRDYRKRDAELTGRPAANGVGDGR